MVHYLMLHMLRQAGSEIHHTLHHQGAPFLRLVSFFMCRTGLSDMSQTLKNLNFAYCGSERSNKSWLSCWDSVWSRSVDVSRDRSLPRRFRFLNCSTGYGPEKQSNVSSSPRFLHIIPVSLWRQAAHSHLSLPPSQIHFASLREKTILWYHFTDSEHVT